MIKKLNSFSISILVIKKIHMSNIKYFIILDRILTYWITKLNDFY